MLALNCAYLQYIIRRGRFTTLPGMIGLKLAGPIISRGHESTNKCMEASADFAQCIMESLVLRYREVFHSMHELKDVIINGVHVLGGDAAFQHHDGRIISVKGSVNAGCALHHLLQ